MNTTNQGQETPLTEFLQGNGLNFAAIPTWASEISGHEERGKVAAFNGWLIIWGVVIAYWVDYACATYTTDMQFRFPIGSSGLKKPCGKHY